MAHQDSSPKKFWISLGVLIQVIAVIALVIVANMAIHWRYPKRLDLLRNDYYKLSDKTVKLLESLNSDVEIIVFFQPDATSYVIQKVYDDTNNLLRGYQSISKHIKVKQVDPDRDLASARKYAEEYGVHEANVIVFVHGKKHKFVKNSEMVEFDTSGGPFNQTDRIKFFKGEQQITSAIQTVLEEQQKKIYFVSGHGEGDPDNPDPRNGLSGIITQLRRDNLLVEKLNILQRREIPKDADVLIIHGPTTPFADEELKLLREYLTHDGRLMVLLEALRGETGLEAMLAEYGVKVGNDAVLMKIQDKLGGEAVLMTALGYIYSNHIITEGLRKDNLTSQLPLARTIDRGETKDRVTVLVQTPEMSWAETNLEKLRKEQAQQDEKDRKGPVPLAVAVEPNQAGDMEREGRRLVVFGSSSFILNSKLKGGNMDLFLNSTNWLLKRQQLIGIAPKTPQEFSLSLDAIQRRYIGLTEVVGLPLGIGILGFMVWFRRRK